MQVAFGEKWFDIFGTFGNQRVREKRCHWASGSPLRNGQLGQNCHLRQRLSTHWGREEMVAISQATFSNAFAWKCVPKGPIDNITALVQTMAWSRPGDKPISEPNMLQFTDACMRHLASMSNTLKDLHKRTPYCRRLFYMYFDTGDNHVSVRTSSKPVPKRPNWNKSALVLAMAGSLIGDRTFPETAWQEYN